MEHQAPPEQISVEDFLTEAEKLYADWQEMNDQADKNIILGRCDESDRQIKERSKQSEEAELLEDKFYSYVVKQFRELEGKEDALKFRSAFIKTFLPRDADDLEKLEFHTKLGERLAFCLGLDGERTRQSHDEIIPMRDQIEQNAERSAQRLKGLLGYDAEGPTETPA